MMTREEVINALKEIKDRAWGWHINEQVLGIDYDKFIEIMDAVLSFLDPVSREQVKKLFPGCPKCRTCNSCAFRYIEPGEEPCLSCNNDTYSNYKAEPSRIFCSTCGSPLTDEAVGITLKRLEALKDGSSTD